MRKISEITIEGVKVKVVELTVADIDAMLPELEKQEEPTALDWMFADEYMTQSLLQKIIDVPVDDFLGKGLAPSELEPLYKEAAKQNPFLVKALSQMRKIADLMAANGLELPQST
ncbi:hypothetical protein [Desulforhopalus singaporensis]|uniref:Uncharacterized protein n=1 Tax=Desulforhopalus singaporensis TaxID=91360 RepID=A0A1H0UTY3_9BACT|nr:hypothetical protein [Desulforhopalus singaporensis]SDP69739.1 hypothetical protein SAMN05660330_03720 [Desulforhopalus singaporensis]